MKMMGDYKNDIGNKSAKREKVKRKQAAGGRYMYGHGGGVKNEGSQPKYDGMPKCMPN